MTAGASSGPAADSQSRSPPAKNVFLAEVMITPVMLDPVRDQGVHALAHRDPVTVVHGVHAAPGVVQGDHDDAVGAVDGPGATARNRLEQGR